MNSVVEAIRKKYPESYTNLSDDELTVAIGKRYTNYLDRTDFAADFGRITKSSTHTNQVENKPAQGILSRGLETYGKAMAGQQLPTAGLPAIEVPRFGEEGTWQRGVSEGVSGLIEGATTPEGIVAAGLLPVPGAAKVIGPLFLGAGAKATGELLGEASVTKSPQTIAEAAVIGGATALGVAAELGGTIRGRRTALKEQANVVEEPPIAKPEDAVRKAIESTPEIPVEHEVVLPSAVETFKETTGEPVKKEAPKPDVQVPVMITRKMERQLSDLGYPEQARNKLTPQEDNDIINEGRKFSGGVKEWALEQQREAGWNTKWPFVPADLMNRDFRSAIRSDPSLSAAEKSKIFEAGEKLRVVPKDEVPTVGYETASGVVTEKPATVKGEVIPSKSDKTQSFGITPSPSLVKFIDAAVPREQGTPPPLQLDTSTNFPDFSPVEVANKNFARTFGVGRVPVLGWLFDPNARIRLPFQESIARYFSERFDVARAQSSAVGEMIRGRIDKSFEIDAAGRLKGVEGTGGKDPFWVDAFEAEESSPGSYNFNPEQRAALQVWLDLKKEADPLLKKYGLSKQLDDEGVPFDDAPVFSPDKGEGSKGYAPRIVRERPTETARVGGGGGSVGAKASFEKSRLFPTMREGFERGVRYETSPEASIAVWSERLYKRIADKRLADDPSIGATPVGEKRAELREYYADKVESGEWTPERLNQTVESIINQGRVDQPAFAGKFVDPEIAAALDKAFPRGQHWGWKQMAQATALMKGLKFGFDFGVGQLQGLPTFFKGLTSPKDAKAWSLGQVNMVKALLSPDTIPDYVKANIEPIRELAAYGSSVGRLNEMVSGIGAGAPFTKAIETAGKKISESGKPLVGKPIEMAGRSMEAFARSFEAFLDVTKVELWKAYREIVPKEQWGDTIRSIETQLLTSRMEGLGISRGQALLERVALIAASYARGYVNLIGGALTQPGVSGSILRKSMAGMLVTGPVLYYGIGKAIGMRDDELVDRMRPDSSEFMTWRVPIGERNVNVGFGGIHRSFVRLIGNTYKQAIEDPKMLHMPLVRWYQGHAGPLVSMAWQAGTGRDFMGNEITLPTVVGKAVLPMTAETVLSTRKDEFETGLADAASGLAGLNSFPQSIGRQFVEERETMAHEKFNKPYEKLSVGDQFKLNVELRRKTLFEERRELTTGQKESQARRELQRQRIINKQLPSDITDKLEVLGVVLPAYDPSLRIGKAVMTFTKAQESAYQNLIVEEYSQSLPKILDNPKLKDATPAVRQELLSAISAKLREKAKLRLLKAINLESDK